KNASSISPTSTTSKHLHNAGQRTELKPPTLYSAVKHAILSCFYDGEFIGGAVSLRKAAPAVK
ncbi:MAG: hypothetical protein CTY36_14300, partial [Methylocystis sp.]